MRMAHAGPVRRTSGLVVKAVGDDVLVYDLERDRAHSLNSVAAAVWQGCDGHRDARAIAATIRPADGIAVPEESVACALIQLAQARLITGPVPSTGPTRRELLRRLGVAGAVALPAVTSLVAPTAVQAQSLGLCPPGTPNEGAPGFPGGAPCTDGAQCCSGICLGLCATITPL
jgi:hypothetical protein